MQVEFGNIVTYLSEGKINYGNCSWCLSCSKRHKEGGGGH